MDYLTGLLQNSYYTFRQGFGCDNVVNFEIVLADGSVVNANSTSHDDLYKALKGGSSNFGIATRFDINTLPNTPLWGSIRTHDYNLYADTALETIVDLANADESQGDNALIVLIVTGGDKNISLMTNQVNTQGVADAPIFAKLSALPALTEYTRVATVGDYTGAGATPAGFRSVFLGQHSPTKADCESPGTCGLRPPLVLIPTYSKLSRASTKIFLQTCGPCCLPTPSEPK